MYILVKGGPLRPYCNHTACTMQSNAPRRRSAVNLFSFGNRMERTKTETNWFHCSVAEGPSQLRIYQIILLITTALYWYRGLFVLAGVDGWPDDILFRIIFWSNTPCRHSVSVTNQKPNIFYTNLGHLKKIKIFHYSWARTLRIRNDPGSTKSTFILPFSSLFIYN